MMALDTILRPVSGLREVRGDRARMVSAIRYDSRRVGTGDLFVAVNGPDDQGLTWVSQAIDKGASTLVVDEPGILPALAGTDVTIVVVEDARLAMAQMAHELAGYPARKLNVYGITGTNGKTTVACVLRQLLEACGQATGLIGTLGKMIHRIEPTGYTTPEAPELVEILDEMVRAGMTSVAMEVSSHALVLERVACIDFAGAVFTNLTQDHMDFHITMDAYRDAKRILFDRLNDNRPAVVNIDDVHGESMVHNTRAAVVRYGTSSSADARIGAVELRPGVSRWKVTLSNRLGGGELSLSSPLVGSFNVYNVTAAVALALATGHDRSTLTDAVSSLSGVPGRLESIPLDDGAVAVIDYAHTPDALEKALTTLRASGREARLTVVFGCGGDRDRAKRPLMGAVAARLADRVILTSDNPRSEDPSAIIDQVADGIPPTIAFTRVVDRAEAIERALVEAQPLEIVLIAGKGHEEYQIIGTERRHFSDREVVERWRDRSTAKQQSTR
jgi:UDP-N-acetylmuramoyl-L-alanyl-D-glutamate--2,6-diaminopimelate ligase